MREFDLKPYALIGISLLVGTSVIAETEIHRCLLDDGTVAFQETPCTEPAVDAGDGSESVDARTSAEDFVADDDVFDFVNPFDEPTAASAAAEPNMPEPVSLDRAECEKTTRDAIDAIDLEMRGKTYTNEQGQEYLAELLALTRQLRGCNTL